MKDSTPLEQAMANVGEQMAQLAARLSTVTMLLRATDVALAETADPPEKFTHTDDYGDGLVVGQLMFSGLSVRTLGDPEVFLDQDAVNRLAQYLDQHRTDRTNPTPTESEERCPWALLRPGTRPEPYGRYDRCEHAAGHTHGGQHHGSGNVRWLSSAPGAFRVDLMERPAPEPVNQVPGFQRCTYNSPVAGLGRCRRLASHEGEHVPSTEDVSSPAMDDKDPIELCAGSLGPDQPANSSGCEHRRGMHGALGCRCHGCPCERRNGR